MALDSDFLQLEVDGKIIARILCQSHGISWPPPKFVELHGRTFKRISMSALTDEQMVGCSNVARGARYIEDLPPEGIRFPDLGSTKPLH